MILMVYICCRYRKWIWSAPKTIGKPAVMAQTDKYVAFGSEFRALASLPDIEKANVWEPEPGIPYFWGE